MDELSTGKMEADDAKNRRLSWPRFWNRGIA